MPKYIIPGLLAIIFTFNLCLLSVDKMFKPVMVIGEEEKEDYILIRISGAVLTSCKDIIIADDKGHFIARYDWAGNFKNKIGQQGKGPDDFYMPKDLGIIDKKIWVFDQANLRIARMDEKLENLEYLRLPSRIGFPAHFKLLDGARFVITSKFNSQYWSHPSKKKEKVRIFFMNLEKNPAEILRGFFNFTPMNVDGINTNNPKTLRRISSLSSVIYGLDITGKRMLVSFTMPDNPLAFFLYDLEGKLIKKFQHPFGKKYAFPHKFYRTGQTSLNTILKMHIPYVTTIFYCNHRWYVVVALKYYKEVFQPEEKYLFLEFDGNGKLLKEYTGTRGLICFYVSPDGYLLGKNPGAELEQLEVYKIR